MPETKGHVATRRWKKNVAKVFDLTADNAEFARRRAALAAKYAAVPGGARVVQQRLERAEQYRAQKGYRPATPRTAGWVKNVAGIFNRTADNAEIARRRAALAATHGKSKLLKQRLAQAAAFRARQQHRNSGGLHRYVDTLNAPIAGAPAGGAQPVRVPPLVNGGRPFDLRAPPEQYYADLRAIVGPMFAEREKVRAGGGTVCGQHALSPHQVIVFETVRAMFTHGMANMGGCRGLLCWHGTGSGKTALAAAIFIAAKLAEKATGVAYNVRIVTTRDNKNNNSPAEYAQNILRYFPQYLGLLKLAPPAKGQAMAEWVAAAAPVVQAALPCYTTTTNTYHTAEVKAHEVVIIDEFQNLIEPRKADMPYKANAEAIQKKLLANESKIFVFPLTATPSAGKIENFAKMANFIRPLGAPVFTPATPPHAYKGLISYVETREDRTMFGELVGDKDKTFHERVKNEQVPMNSRYCFAFLQSFSEADVEPTTGAADLYMKKLTEKATILAVGDAKKAGIDMAAWEAEKRIVRITATNRQVVLSNKMMAVIKNIVSLPGKQFVFAANPTISKCIEAALLQHHGFARVSTRDIPTKGSGKMPYGMDNGNGAGQKAPRYMCYGTGKRDGFASAHGRVPVDTFDKGHLRGMREIMKHKANLNGDYCKIMVAMGSNFEGLNIPAWRGVHIVQPLATKDSDEQAIGRALRACGHADLPAAERNAYVVRYFSTIPQNFDPEAIARELKGAKAASAVSKCDENLAALRGAGLYKNRTSPNVIVFADAQMKQKKLDDFEACIQQYAIDCPLLRDALRYTHPCGGETCAPAKASIDFSKFGVSQSSAPGRPAGVAAPIFKSKGPNVLKTKHAPAAPPNLRAKHAPAAPPHVPKVPNIHNRRVFHKPSHAGRAAAGNVKPQTTHSHTGRAAGGNAKPHTPHSHPSPSTLRTHHVHKNHSPHYTHQSESAQQTGGWLRRLFGFGPPPPRRGQVSVSF